MSPSVSEPFVDIHCHIVPGLDDGSASPDESLAMARTAVTDGIAAIVATPHQLGNHRECRGAQIRERVARLQRQLDEQGVPLRVLPGADVRVEPDMIRLAQSGEVVTLADRGRHLLLELPHELYLPLDRLLSQLTRAGLVGILSHPERNEGILRKPEVLEPLVDSGCLMQVTAGSLVGTFGGQVQRLSETLIERGLVHFVATDAHGARSRRPLMRRAFERVVALADLATARELCCTNPVCVVEGRDVPAGRRRRGLWSFSRWFGRRRAG
jgi:protein-tyrosine phosphatase